MFVSWFLLITVSIRVKCVVRRAFLVLLAAIFMKLSALDEIVLVNAWLSAIT